MSIESVMTSNPLIFCSPLLLLPSIFPSIRVFSNESTLCITWPKYWSCSFSISLSNDIQGWFPLGLTSLISLLFKGLFKRIFSRGSCPKGKQHVSFYPQLSQGQSGPKIRCLKPLGLLQTDVCGSSREGFEIRSSKHLLCLLPHCLHCTRPFHKLLGSFNLPNNPVKQELQNPFDKNGKWGSGN